MYILLEIENLSRFYKVHSRAVRMCKTEKKPVLLISQSTGFVFVELTLLILCDLVVKAAASYGNVGRDRSPVDPLDDCFGQKVHDLISIPPGMVNR